MIISPVNSGKLISPEFRENYGIEEKSKVLGIWTINVLLSRKSARILPAYRCRGILSVLYYEGENHLSSHGTMAFFGT
jgi:hypothetical protein